jgi:hypothetical protein
LHEKEQVLWKSIEQQLIQMLKRFPIPITMTWTGGLYHWLAAGHTGSASDFVTAMDQALRSVLAEHVQSTERAASL